jgi:hypothetical protein
MSILSRGPIRTVCVYEMNQIRVYVVLTFKCTTSLCELLNAKDERKLKQTSTWLLRILDAKSGKRIGTRLFDFLFDWLIGTCTQQADYLFCPLNCAGS